MLCSVIVIGVTACLFQYRNLVFDVQGNVDHPCAPTARHQDLPFKDIAQTGLPK
jgi:hypothetical protein